MTSGDDLADEEQNHTEEDRENAGEREQPLSLDFLSEPDRGSNLQPSKNEGSRPDEHQQCERRDPWGDECDHTGKDADDSMDNAQPARPLIRALLPT
jgi:hypothetical protein